VRAIPFQSIYFKERASLEFIYVFFDTFVRANLGTNPIMFCLTDLVIFDHQNVTIYDLFQISLFVRFEY